MKALRLPTVMPRLASKLATAFFGHGEARRVINLSGFYNPIRVHFGQFSAQPISRTPQ